MRNNVLQEWLLGAARSIDLSGSISMSRTRQRVVLDSEESIRRDWEQVGDDLRSAMGEWKVRNAEQTTPSK